MNFLKTKQSFLPFDEKSKQSVAYSGPRTGIEHQPDVKKVFQQSIEELAAETKLDLKFKEISNETSSSQTNVNADVTENFMGIQAYHQPL